MDIAKNVINKTQKEVKGYSPEFNDLVGRMLDKNPATRIKWLEVVAHPWWKGLKFEVPELPEEPHFNSFLKRYGYLLELD